ncbi:unnamed protein product [Prorocentrum cordatum]|uniref:Uncharacterized protein n=1 Tax=Prorocentrum cordatum TaxID=2364126 RepID=A0ABN9V3H6_9DINO|nr:unnamed protein product [Polarella glacialis]
MKFEETLPPILELLQFSGQRAKSRSLFLEPQATHFPHMGGLYDDTLPQARSFPTGPNGCRPDVSTDAEFANYYGSILHILATHKFPTVTPLPFWERSEREGCCPPRARRIWPGLPPQWP